MAFQTLKESVEVFVEERTSYYKQWVFDKPFIIGKSHHKNLIELQQIMHKLIKGFVENYADHKNLMPVSEEVEELLELCNQRAYKPGTYRTDFVYDNTKQVKLIEITCRFALNGMFLSAVMNNIAAQHQSIHLPNESILNPYEGIFEHFESYLENIDHICILTGNDRRNESKIYESIFTRMGIQISEVPFTKVQENLELLSSSWIISELAFDEILSIPKDMLKVLSSLNVINDFRTVFLIHDKRFFEVLCNQEFQASILSKEEVSFFSQYLVPTYTFGQVPELWQEARKNKDQWIIKHRALGKSQQIYAGIVTDAKDWEKLFIEDDFGELILQKWIDQTTVNGSIDGHDYEDFVTGTLLFFDEHYFGFGDFRTSSFPVTNVVDHRKACSLILNHDEKTEALLNYNYIN